MICNPLIFLVLLLLKLPVLVVVYKSQSSDFIVKLVKNGVVYSASFTSKLILQCT